MQAQPVMWSALIYIYIHTHTARRKLMAQLVIECTNVPIMLNIVTDWGGAFFFFCSLRQERRPCDSRRDIQIHICTCISIHKYILDEVCTCIHIYICTYAHVLVYINTYIYATAGVKEYIHIYAYILDEVCTCIHIHICTCVSIQ
jgi:hypothetical protein